MSGTAAAVFALAVIGFVSVSRRVGRAHLTAPILFAAVGWLLSMVAEEQVEPSTIRGLAELALAVILFHDAAQVRPREIRHDLGLASRLLLIGLPLTMVLGLGTAMALFPGMELAFALLVAAILAPTDAGLGAATVLNPVVPARVRRLLNVESGLNDGLSTPVVLFAIALVASGAEEQGHVLGEALIELGIACAFGVGAGAIACHLLAHARTSGWAESSLISIAVAVIPLLTYYGAIDLGGNGFVAVFLSGTAFAWGFGGARTRDHERAMTVVEPLSVLLGYLVWTVFGFAGLNEVVGLPWQCFAFAALSLTVLRMGPVALSLLGSGLRMPTVLFIGWFGPRGMASVVFTVIALESLPMTSDLRDVVGAAVLTIIGSVILHGITADPWAQRYGTWAGRVRPPVETAA